MDDARDLRSATSPAEPTVTPGVDPTLQVTGLSRRDLLRRGTGVVAGTALAAAGVAGAAAAPAPKRSAPAVLRQGAGEVVLYNWYANWINEVAPIFEQETGIKVTSLGNYASNDEWWAKLNAGETWDFFIPTTDWVQRANAADLLTQLDLGLIPNSANIFPDYQNIAELRKDDKPTALPFTRVYYALTYNTEQFPTAPTSWEATWDPAHGGKLALQDQAYARVGIAALTLDDNPLEPQKMDEIKGRLMEQKPLVLNYWKDYQSGMQLFIDGGATVGQLTDGRTRMGKDLGAPIAWTIPQEGALLFIDNFAIPKDAPNAENGHRFIDFLLREDIMLRQMRGMRYDTVNAAAYAQLTPEEQAAFAAPEGAKLILTTDLKANVRKSIDDLWNEVKLS